MASLLKYCFGLPEVAYGAGSHLIVEGRGRGPLFVLVCGRVSVHRGGQEVAVMEAPGAIFGEVSALLDITHSASVDALTDVKVHVIENATEFLQSRPQIALQVAAILARRLNDTTRVLVEARQPAGGEDAAALTATVEAIVRGRTDGAED